MAETADTRHQLLLAAVRPDPAMHGMGAQVVAWIGVCRDRDFLSMHFTPKTDRNSD